MMQKKFYMKKQWINFLGLHNEYIVSLHEEEYLNNQRLAVEVVAHDGGAEVPYALVTRNFLDEPISGPACSFFDSNNYGYILEWILCEGICTLTGNFVVSGYCVYPEVEFDLALLQEGDAGSRAAPALTTLARQGMLPTG